MNWVIMGVTYTSSNTRLIDSHVHLYSVTAAQRDFSGIQLQQQQYLDWNRFM